MTLDVIVPMYNEEACARPFVDGLLTSLAALEGMEIRLLLVDDGSSDRTGALLDRMAADDPRIRAIHLWGNHGHQRALAAGLDHCDGDLVLMLDGDGQHPPEVAADLVRTLCGRPDAYVCQGIRRGTQAGRIKNLTSGLFYRLANLLLSDTPIQPGSSDFRAIRSPVVGLLRRFPDRHRNLRILLASLRLPTIQVEYDVAPRLGGSSKYGLRKMMALAADGWFAFSWAPLRASLLLMAGCLGLLVIYLGYVSAMFVWGRTVPGWTSLIALTSFLFAAVFAVLAILSEYVARIYADVRGHPVYRLRPDGGPYRLAASAEETP